MRSQQTLDDRFFNGPLDRWDAGERGKARPTVDGKLCVGGQKLRPIKLLHGLEQRFKIGRGILHYLNQHSICRSQPQIGTTDRCPVPGEANTPRLVHVRGVTQRNQFTFNESF